MRNIAGASILPLLALVAACTAPQPPMIVSDPDPSVKIPATKLAAEKHDMTSVRQMIKDLESDDPAVRFYAFSGLQKLTGETFGYQYYADEDKRAPAVGKWKAWLAGWEAAQHNAGKN